MFILLHILAFLMAVLILVTVHEWGHFIVARCVGVHVLKFSLGFGRALWRHRAKNGTEYVIAILPLGGYVKLLDEREAPVPPEKLHLAFNRKPLLSRILVVVAGPGINVLFAVIAFWLMFVIGVQEVKPILGDIPSHSIAAESGLQTRDELVSIDHHAVSSWQEVALALIRRMGDRGTIVIQTKSASNQQIQDHQLAIDHWSMNALNPDPFSSLGIIPYTPPIPAVIAKMRAESPAARAGLKVGDQVLQVNLQKVGDWQQFVKIIQARPGQQVDLKVQRGGQIINFKVTVGRKFAGWRRVGYLGIESAPIHWPPSMKINLQHSPLGAVLPAWQQTWSFLTFNFVLLGKMILGKISMQAIGGPITIFQSAGAAFAQGLVIYISFLGLISVMLAFVNILPIPSLDGGHLLFFIIEGIMQKPLSMAWQLLIYKIGLIFLVVLMVQATVNDLMRLF